MTGKGPKAKAPKGKAPKKRVKKRCPLPECTALITSQNLARHLKEVHGLTKEAEEEGESHGKSGGDTGDSSSGDESTSTLPRVMVKVMREYRVSQSVFHVWMN
jgi:hypothetical protein